MKLDPGIHIVMHSVLSLKPGVTCAVEATGHLAGDAWPVQGAKPVGVFYVYALMKVSVNLYAPKKFGHTYMPSRFFSRDLCALLDETGVMVGNGSAKRPLCPSMREAVGFR